MQVETVYSIHDLMEYIVCPARHRLNLNSKNLPDRYMTKKRLTEKTPEYARVLSGMVEKDEGTYRGIAYSVVEGLNYNAKATDLTAIKKMLEGIDLFIQRRGITVDSEGKPFTINYGMRKVASEYDLIITDPKTARKYPALIDYSNTKYEAEFNPIVYRAQTCMDYFNAADTNTVVKIITVSTESYWEYRADRYSALVTKSIVDTIRSIEFELYPIRFGWWCSGCHWRGMCHMARESKLI